MSSGITMSEESKKLFTDLQRNKTYRYLIFKIHDSKEVKFEEGGDRSATYEDFKQKLITIQEADECCYAVYDLEFDTPDGKRDKLLMFTWIPDTCTVKKKMVYSSTKDNVKRTLGEGIHKNIQANDTSDLEFSSVLEIAKRK